MSFMRFGFGFERSNCNTLRVSGFFEKCLTRLHHSCGEEKGGNLISVQDERRRRKASEDNPSRRAVLVDDSGTGVTLANESPIRISSKV